MKYEKLSNLLNISMGKTPARKETKYWGIGHAWVSIRDLKSKTINFTKEQITEIAVKESRIKVVPKGTLLFSFKLTIGKMAFAGCDLYTNEAIAAFAIKDSKQLNSDYLYYALKSVNFLGSNQAAMGKTLNSKSLAEIRIPLPATIEEQIIIAHILGKVENLINQREQHLQELDDLLKSVFFDMFGDPINNEKCWVPQSFSNLFSVKPKIGTTKPASDDGTVPVVRVGELGRYQVNFNKCKKINPDQINLENCKVHKGDILLARAIGSIEHLGKASLITELKDETAFDSHVMRIRFKSDKVNPVFGYYWLKSDGGRRLFLKASGRTSVQFNINSKQISSIIMPLPPIELQNQFTRIFDKIEKTKTRYLQNLIELENLYGSLSQKAFKGELDLSNISSETAREDEVDDELELAELEREQDIKISNQMAWGEEYPMSNAKGRSRLIRAFFDGYMDLADAKDFSIDAFFEYVNFKVLDYMDEDDKPFGFDEYELVKGWLFNEIRLNQMKQTRNTVKFTNEDPNDSSKSIDKRKFGNTIQLRSRHGVNK